MKHKHYWTTDYSNYKRICKICGAIFKDMDTYLFEVCDRIPINTVIDVGTGMKGVVGEHFWLHRKKIKAGWMVDIWNLKPSHFWRPLKINALNLEQYFKPKSVDVVQAFGFLEHLEKEDGYRFLRIAENIAKKVVIVSAASTLHGPTPDYKVNIDGNPYHLYRSTWKWDEFNRIGYKTSYEDMVNGLTYSEEVIAWRVLNPT